MCFFEETVFPPFRIQFYLLSFVFESAFFPQYKNLFGARMPCMTQN